MRTVEQERNAAELKQNCNANLFIVQVRIGFTMSEQRSTLSNTVLRFFKTFKSNKMPGNYILYGTLQHFNAPS